MTFESSRIVCTLSAGSMKGRVDDASEFTATLLRYYEQIGLLPESTLVAQRQRPGNVPVVVRALRG